MKINDSSRRRFVRNSLATSMSFSFAGLIRAHGGGGGETTTHATTDSGTTTTWDPEYGTTGTTTWDPEATTCETTLDTTAVTTALPQYRITCVQPLEKDITEPRVEIQTHGTSKYYFEIKFYSGFSRTQDVNIIGTGPRKSYFVARIIRVNNNNEEIVEQELATRDDERSFILNLSKPSGVEQSVLKALADNDVQSQNLRHKVVKVEENENKVTFKVKFWTEGSLNGQELDKHENIVEHTIEFVSHPEGQPPP